MNRITYLTDELITDSQIQSGKGFDAVDDMVTIENDSVSVSNIDDKKYVLFLYSLDKEQLDSVIDFIIPLLEQISIRAWNGIKSLGYREFLVNYLFADSLKLLNLRNFGKKSVADFNVVKPAIIDFIKELYNGFNTDSVDDALKQETIKKKPLKERLGETQYRVITGFLEKYLESASVRSRNAIKSYGNDFIEDFVNKNNDIKTIKNVGRKSESEIALIITNIRDYVATLENKALYEEDLFIIKKNALYGEHFDEYANSFYSRNGHLPMFYILESLFNALLKKYRNFQLYNLRTPIFKNKEIESLESIAKKHRLTRERVRQIHMKVRKHLIEVDSSAKEGMTYSIAKFIIGNNDWNYVTDEFQDNNYIDLSMVTNKYSQENHQFTDDFILFLIGTLCRDTFIPIGKPILPYPTRSKDEWINCYLVKKELTEKFDFTRFLDMVKEYENSNTDDLKASVRELIIDTFFEAWISYDSSAVEEISEVVSCILIQEVGIIPDDDFNFTIEGKKQDDVSDAIYNILKLNGNPISCDDLLLSINSMYPRKFKSISSIKAIVYRDIRMCFVGSNNLVALIEWEHIKLGSIRNIIIQYLEQSEEPQKVKEIVSYVQKYRDTSEHSIRSTIGSGEQFVNFGGGYYGLKWKEYPEVSNLDKKDSLFHKRIQEFEQFLQAHNHFPFSSDNQQEMELHEWWKQIKLYSNLNEFQKSEIKRIETKYKCLARKKRHLHWFDNCRNYHEFIQEYHRRPSMSNAKEKDLSLWLKKASQDFSNGTLTHQQEMCYLDLCKSL